MRLRDDHPDLASALLRPERDRACFAVTLACALVLHGGIAAGLPTLALRGEAEADVVEVDLSPPEPEVPEEPQPPEPELEEPESPEPEPPPKVESPAPSSEPPPAAAAPAEAAEVLTAAPDPDEPVDLTGGFVTGSGATYAGGSTSSTGTAKAAVRARVVGAAAGAPAATGPAATAVVPAEDRPRAAGLVRGGEWSCPWPSEADAEQIDEASVIVKVSVDASGKASAVSVLQDPGHGFGREARTCAMRETYTAALDREGRAIAGSTKAIRIRFQR